MSNNISIYLCQHPWKIVGPQSRVLSRLVTFNVRVVFLIGGHVFIFLIILDVETLPKMQQPTFVEFLSNS